MARLVVAVAIVAAIAATILLISLGLRVGVRKGDRVIGEMDLEQQGLQRIAFVLLIALVLYVAVVGGSS